MYVFKYIIAEIARSDIPALLLFRNSAVTCVVVV